MSRHKQRPLPIYRKIINSRLCPYICFKPEIVLWRDIVEVHSRLRTARYSQGTLVDHSNSISEGDVCNCFRSAEIVDVEEDYAPARGAGESFYFGEEGRNSGTDVVVVCKEEFSRTKGVDAVWGGDEWVFEG